MKFKVYDDFISSTYQYVIKEFIESPETHWHYQPYMDDNNAGYSQFVHAVFDKEENINDHLLHNLICGLLSKIKDELCPQAFHIRTRAILQTPIPNPPKHYNPHIDTSNNLGISFIYYTHDADGYTYLIDKNNNVLDSVTPKQGRLIMFPSNQLHAGSPPKEGRRMLLNTNFLNSPNINYNNG
mgnify:FL=1